jgi:hypothetical protein
MNKLYPGFMVIISLAIPLMIFLGVITFSSIVSVPLLLFAEDHFALLNLGTILLILLSVIIIARRKRKTKNKVAGFFSEIKKEI